MKFIMIIKMKFELKTLKQIFICFIIGLINGLFGAGGGMLAVPLLKSCGLNQKHAHANSIAVILPLSCFSVVLYILYGNVNINLTIKLIPFGLAGAVVGTFLLRKISGKVLQRIFSLILLYAGIRMIIF